MFGIFFGGINGIMNGIRVSLFFGSCVLFLVLLGVCVSADDVYLYPDGDDTSSSYLSWDKTGVDYYSEIDEVVLDTGDYVETAFKYNSEWIAFDVEDEGSYADNDIISVTVYATCQRESGDISHSLKLGLRKGGSNYYQPTGTSISTSQTTVSYTWTTDPSDSNAWTWDDINSSSLVLRDTAGSGSNYNDLKIYQSYLVVSYCGSDVFTENATNVEGTTVTLNGVLGCTADSATCGFWYGFSSPVTELTKAGNLTCVGSYDTGESFFYDATGGVSGDYYFYRAWCQNGTLFVNASNEATFLLKPNAPDTLSVTNIDEKNVSLSWNQASVGAGTNRSTVIVYKTGGYPSSVSDGTVCYNESGTSTTVTMPSGGTKYYFSAWTYINASGGPFYWYFSDDYDYVSATTEGGDYTVYVRDEQNGSLLNLSDVNMTHMFRALDEDGQLLYRCYPDNATGTFSFDTDGVVKYARFRYNETCYRTVTVSEGQTNITFYMSTSRIGVYNGNLTSVVIYFVDYSGTLASSDNQMGWVYTYNETSRWTIHKDQLQADMSIRTDLVIGDVYYIGVGCDAFTYDNIRILTITQSEFEVEITVGASTNDTVIGEAAWFDKINVLYGWNGNTLFCDVEDVTKDGDVGVDDAVVRLYFIDNSTLIETYNPGVPWDFNYTYNGDQSTGYYVMVDVNYTDENSSWSKTFIIHYLSIIDPLFDPEFDDLMNNTLGLSPVYYEDDVGVEHIVSWSGTIVIFMLIIPLMMFGREFAGLGISICGGLIWVFNGLIHMITVENTLLATFLVIFGMFTIMATRKTG